MFRSRRRIQQQTGRFSRVDGIPTSCRSTREDSPALMAAFTIDARRRPRALLPGNEVHPLRLSGNTRPAARHGDRLPGHGHRHVHRVQHRHRVHAWRAGPRRRCCRCCSRSTTALGQYVVDLPVSTRDLREGRQGHLGHAQAPGEPGLPSSTEQHRQQPVRPGRPAGGAHRDRPARQAWLPLRDRRRQLLRVPRHADEVRHLLPRASSAFRLGKKASARLHPRGPSARAAAEGAGHLARSRSSPGFLPSSSGVLDDHFESWFLTYPDAARHTQPEGLESVVNLGLGQQWLTPPTAAGRQPTLPPVASTMRGDSSYPASSSPPSFSRTRSRAADSLTGDAGRGRTHEAPGLPHARMRACCSCVPPCTWGRAGRWCCSRSPSRLSSRWTTTTSSSSHR